MNNIQNEIDKMYSGDADAILLNINSKNDYLVLNAILSGTKQKIKDEAFIDGVKKAQNNVAVLLGFPIKSVAEASICYLTGKEYKGNDSVIKSLITNKFII